ncbi:3-oxoacyl-ACP synthase III family protein [Streptomyces sp. NBC_00199]|uniref:3-oxoacyl-ACP synthase III family protein n=1 Tax=Streptomyces sp. NBC_00199 TaxID=2975678 RepID=UPI0022521A2A|nr:3-oxoacyl-ACP synthase III family protein [Streptomyces sp. NBC_00199]MCX5269223.1 3-oxoacyl-ACP synthase III family protein [Streptomyces sp. NBC_00199]MCX5269767.1 3-oxoacyl-ACP synthase III family protein [Streptomyces sp. NBC_00199]
MTPHHAPGAPLHIAGTGTALPGDPVDNARLGKTFGIDEEWIDLFVGTRTRHFGWDLATGEIRHSLTDLCAEAAARAADAAGARLQDLDFLVLATTTPDRLLPTTANEVADRLGLDHLPTYQIQAGCSGAVQALDLARALLAAGHRSGLVIGGDTTARFLDPSRTPTDLPTQELVNYVLFGDGAGAAVVSTEPLGEALAVRTLLHRFSGRGRTPGQIIDWDGPVRRDTGRQMLSEDYKAVEEGVPVLAGEIYWELLDSVGWTPADVDFLLPPQLSARMTARITESLGASTAHEVSCVVDTGNTGNALPLLQLDRLLARLPDTGRALALVVESSKWIRAGLVLERTHAAEPRP